MSKKILKFILFILIISIAVILIAITVYKANIIHDSRKNISGEIESVMLISDPENDSAIKKYINTSVSENKYEFDDNFSSFSDTEKNMKFDLKKYNVYKVVVKFQNNSNMPIIIKMNTYIKDNQYIVIPSVIPYTEVAENFNESWEYYVFISKDYSSADIEEYLKLQGANFNVVFQKKNTGGSFVVNCKL